MTMQTMDKEEGAGSRSLVKKGMILRPSAYRESGKAV